ncbi:MAG: hypothetical protein EZS28_046549, partial [Streblomastix strix]
MNNNEAPQPLFDIKQLSSNLSKLAEEQEEQYDQIAWVIVDIDTKFALAAHNICFEAPDENVGMDFLKHTEIRLNENGKYELDEDEQEQEQDVDNALEIENDLEE